MNNHNNQLDSKRIIQVVQHLQPGGIETMVLDFLRLAEDNEMVRLVSMEGEKDATIKAWPRLEAYRDQLIFLNKPPGWHLGSFLKLFTLFRKIKPHVVHTHHIGPMIYAATMARLAGVKHIIHTEHDAWHLQDEKRRKLQGWAMKLAKPTMVADAGEVAANLKKFISDCNAAIILNGIDCELFSPGDADKAKRHYGIPENVKIIGTAGRLETVKAQHILIRAMAEMPNEYHCVIAGSGSQEVALKTLVDELDIQDRIHFLGLIDDMPIFYQALDVFCLPSLNEGLPLSLLEAQASDVNVVASNVGGIPEAVCPETGYLVEVDNIQGFAQALISTITNQEKHNKSPRDFVLRKADIRHMHQQYRALSQ